MIERCANCGAPRKEHLSESLFAPPACGRTCCAAYVAPTTTTEEAMAVLEATSSDRIACARRIARELIGRHGVTNSPEVFGLMVERGHATLSEKTHWLGAVFRSDEFEWTGRYVSHRSRVRNIHERTVKEWKLRTTP